VSCPALPGCWSQGATEEEAMENIRDAIREYLAAIKDTPAKRSPQASAEVLKCKRTDPLSPPCSRVMVFGLRSLAFPTS
jgi:hypothetical protein